MGKRSDPAMEAWREGTELVRRVFKLARLLSENDGPDMGRSLRRAAISIPANIAMARSSVDLAGFGKKMLAARHSGYELSTLLDVTDRLHACIEIDACQGATEDLIEKLWKLTRALSDEPVSPN